MKKLNSLTPIIGFAAYSGTGKTSLLEKLIPIFNQHKLRIAVIKHAHHKFDIDHPGKDSYKLRKAGAVETIVASKYRWALIHENQNNTTEPDLKDLIQQVDSKSIDIILVEGFKHEAIPRIELRRSTLNKPLLYPQDQNIIAIATDKNDKMSHPIPTLDINNPTLIFAHIRDYFLLSSTF